MNDDDGDVDHYVNDDTACLLPDINGDNNKKQSIDDILEKAGGLGRYQIFIQSVSFVIMTTISYQAVLMYYIADDPSWQCSKSKNSSVFCRNHPGIIKSDNDLFSQRCSLDPGEWRIALPSPSTYSIITEFKLYCSDSNMASLAHSAYFIGSGVTCMLVGYASDAYGRKHAFCVSALVLLISASSLYYINAVWQFVLVRILVGAGTGGCLNTLYVYLVEFVLPKHRALTSNIIQVSYAAALFYVTLIAYLQPEWRRIALYAALPGASGLVCLAMYQSPRWLLIKQRNEEAEKVLQKLSIFNKQPINVTIRFDATADTNKPQKTYSILDFFLHKKVASIAVSIFLIRYLKGVVYYTMYLEFAQIGGSIYFIMILSATADFPALFLASYFPNKYGRKKSFVASALMIVVFICPMIFTPAAYSNVVLVRTVSAFFIKCSFACFGDVLSLWTLEIFPTVVRTQGVSFTQIGEMIGAGTASFIVDFLRTIHYTAPYITIAAMTLATVFFCFILPETFLRPSRELFEDFFEDKNNSIDDTNSSEINEKFEGGTHSMNTT